MLKVYPGLPYGRYRIRSNQIYRDRLEFSQNTNAECVVCTATHAKPVKGKIYVKYGGTDFTPESPVSYAIRHRSESGKRHRWSTQRSACRCLRLVSKN